MIDRLAPGSVDRSTPRRRDQLGSRYPAYRLLQLGAWALVALFVAGFTGVVRKT